MSNSRNFGLDIVRALAISLVLVSHFGHKNFDFLGFWGVEFFFVLSGFLIGGILYRSFISHEVFDFKLIYNFWSRRWWRTLPNYFLFFFLYFLFAYFNDTGLFSVPLPSIGRIIQYGLFSANLLSFKWDFYIVSWSLCVEEWFYLTFPIVLYIVYILFKKIEKNRIYFISILVIIIFSVSIKIYLSASEVSDLRTITFARIDAIGYGVLSSYIYERYKLQTKSLFLISISLLLVVVTFSFNAHEGMVEFFKQNPLSLVLVPLSLSMVIPIFKNIRILNLTPLIVTCVTNLSLWSYSVYLSHFVLMELFYVLFRSLNHSFISNLIIKIFSLIITLILSKFLFEKFETKVTNLRPKEINKK